jgi:hypothetical protein
MGAKILGIVAAGIASFASYSSAADVEITIKSETKQQVVEDFIEVPTTVLLFRPLPIKPEDADMYCSPTWFGSFLIIEGIAVALNAAAIEATHRRSKLTFDGVVLEFVDPTSIKSPLRTSPDAVRKLVARAGRVCHKIEEAPKVVATPTRRAPEDALATAYIVCGVVDAAGFASKPCEVSAWHAAVQVTADVRGLEARAICAEVSKAIRKNDWPFGGWKIEIYSPFSGGNTVAFCTP